jgi:hypothetical protein
MIIIVNKKTLVRIVRPPSKQQNLTRFQNNDKQQYHID